MSYFLTVPYTKLISLPPNEGVMYSPRLPTALELGSSRTQFSFPSVVDSGADYCIFPLEFGERLGIDFKSLQPSPASGFGGGGQCFYHKINVLVIIENLGLKFECFAGFSDQMNKLGIGLPASPLIQLDRG